MADSLERGQAELERSNAELKRSNAELEQFASVTSHDLQAPLTTISMYAELLERRPARADGGHDLINGIRGATTQARTLIRDLLEYSRAGRGELSVEPLPVELVVNQALEALAGSIEATGARVQVGSLPVVLADRSNLCRVFQNLIGNAVKFTRGDDPRVSIDAEPDGVDVAHLGARQRHRHGRREREAHLRAVSPPARRGGLPGDRHRPRRLRAHRRAARRPDLGLEHAGEGSVFSFTMPAAEVGDEVVEPTPQAPVAAGT